MEFPNTYFEDEVREGFYVPGIMKRCWAVQLEILQIIDKACKKHGIRWFADCGTLLGAVRHGGYIPWDDDLDICMLRPDYIKFNRIIRDEIPEKYVVLNLNNEGEDTYFEYTTRVTNGHGLNFEPDFLEEYHQFPYAVGIDIFPIDYIAQDEEEENRRKLLLGELTRVAETIKSDNSDVEKYRDSIEGLARKCNVIIDYGSCVKQQLYQMIEKVFSMYSEVGGEYVALMHYWIHYNDHKYSVHLFDKTIMLPFENISIPVPAAYDEVLRIEYGNYLYIYKNGGVHNYPYFMDQEKYLLGLISNYPFIYKFSRKHLDNPERKENPGIKTQVLAFFELLGEVHNALVTTVSAGSYDTAVDILIACQSSAISVGTAIERKYGEGTDTVAFLEKYCEKIYSISELINDISTDNTKQINQGELMTVLTNMQNDYRKCIEREILGKKEVLFILTKADGWGAFDGFYRAAVEAGDCDVFVMPVPYYERNAMGEKGKLHYEIEQFPDNINLTDYREYNIRERHPDVIFIQNPYDQCNYTTCTDSEFFSANLKMYTDRLVYIPWFRLEEIEEGNFKAKRVMDYYCRMPGLAHADTVIVQSAGMREEYIKYLSGFAGADTCHVWESKIIDGSTLDIPMYVDENGYERKLRSLESIPEAWKDVIIGWNGEVKKVIVYNTTITSIMHGGSKALDRIKESLRLFEKDRDKLALVWRLHEGTMSVITYYKPELASELKQIIEDYCSGGWGIFDSSINMPDQIYLYDSYYGDEDALARKMRLAGKPVTIETTDI